MAGAEYAVLQHELLSVALRLLDVSSDKYAKTTIVGACMAFLTGARVQP